MSRSCFSPRRFRGTLALVDSCFDSCPIARRVPVAPALSLLALVSLATPARALEGELRLAAEGRYSQLLRRSASDPSLAHGGGPGIQLLYGLSDAWMVSAAGSLGWFAPWVPRIPTEIVNEEGERVPVLARGDRHDGILAAEMVLSVLYALDVMRVLPYFGAGVISARLGERRAGERFVDWEVGLRFEVGLDYDALEHISIGAAARFDTYFTTRSAYIGKNTFLARITFRWDLVSG
ncbi:MAG: hypothetical protein R6V85_20935 [Polyangia bacterium]